MGDVTQIAENIQSANVSMHKLMPHVYDELRRLASRRLSNDAEQNLQTTDLVHEAYLKLVGANRDWECRAHFFGAAAEAMRRILVDRARSRMRKKRGGEMQRSELQDTKHRVLSTQDEVLIVDELFDRLNEKHADAAEVAKLRYFADLNNREVAEILDISVSVVHSRWVFAKAWLFREYNK